MRQILALLAIAWAAGNLLVAYLLLTGGSAAKMAAKGFSQQALLWSGGLLIGLFALLLAWQCLALAISHDET